MKTRVLLFIGSLRTGGKERRLVELLTYFRNNESFEFLLVMTEDVIQFPYFFQLNIPYKVIRKQTKGEALSVFYQFYKICREFKPDIIHSWGRIQSLYTLPTVIAKRLTLVNSQITTAPPNYKPWSLDSMIDKLNFRFSKLVLSNSKTGIQCFRPPETKGKVIYNGMDMKRFNDLPPVDLIRDRYGIKTPFAVIMSASFTNHKNYDLFYEIARYVIGKRSDITFIGVGGYGKSDAIFKKMKDLSNDNPRILFPGRVNEVEALVNVCTIGVLFSLHGEGISNSILEYMALGKPVIANDNGGTKELVQSGINGYLVTNESSSEIGDVIMDLIDQPDKCRKYGIYNKKIIEDNFVLDKMGAAFESAYMSALS
ncbi:MAG: glycosyltransferase [Flavisolibacter sp.]